jgi:hypothetical protein
VQNLDILALRAGADDLKHHVGSTFGFNEPFLNSLSENYGQSARFRWRQTYLTGTTERFTSGLERRKLSVR